MKNNKWYYILTIVAGLCGLQIHAQNVGINEDGSAPNANAILDVKSNTKGILVPRISTSARLAIPNTKGLLVYDTTANSFWFNNGAGWQNLSSAGSISKDSIWSLNGNAKLGATNFIGTTDSSVLKFRVNNIPAGSIDVFDNAFFGTRAGQANAPIVSGNTVAGIDNTAFGSGALSANTSGLHNVAVGAGAISRSVTGINNTAVGQNAMILTTGGVNDVAIGTGALFHNGNGSQNTAIGAGADVTSDSLTNATAIGAGAFVNASNKVRIGNSFVTVIEGQVPFTNPSDGRFKYQVREDVKGLDFILQLRPVTYQFDVKRFDEQGGNPNGAREARQVSNVIQAAYKEAAAIRRSGFIAQEVEKAADVSGYDFSGIIRPKTEQEHYSLSYESFVVPLVKGMQEQQRIILEQRKDIRELREGVVQQLQKIDSLQQQIDELRKLVIASK